MKLKFYLIIFLLNCSLHITFGQKDTLNKYNSKGKKTGYWKVFLDENARPTDSSNAFFYGYNLYANGKYLWEFEKRLRGFDIGKTVYEGKPSEKGRPELLTGKVLTYYSFGPLLREEIYKNGSPVLIKTYHKNKKNPTMDWYEIVYFDRLYNNLIGSFYLEEFYNNKIIKKAFYYKVKRKWKYFVPKDTITTV